MLEVEADPGRGSSGTYYLDYLPGVSVNILAAAAMPTFFPLFGLE